MTRVPPATWFVAFLCVLAAPALLRGDAGAARDYQCKYLSSSNFSGQDLSGANFSYSVIGSTQFQGAKLREAVLEYCVASDARFDGADLTGARLSSSVLTDASFKGANCRGARFGYCVLAETDFTGADLRGAKLNNAVLGGRFDAKSLYDESTQFPKGFDPVKRGLTLVRSETQDQDKAPSRTAAPRE